MNKVLGKLVDAVEDVIDKRLESKVARRTLGVIALSGLVVGAVMLKDPSLVVGPVERVWGTFVDYVSNYDSAGNQSLGGVAVNLANAHGSNPQV